MYSKNRTVHTEGQTICFARYVKEKNINMATQGLVRTTQKNPGSHHETPRYDQQLEMNENARETLTSKMAHQNK